MKYLALFALGFIAITGFGCSDYQPTTAAAAPAPVPYSPKERRFETINPSPSVVGWPIGGYALDTKTGRLCRTWDWVIKQKDGSELPTNTPTCYSLYQSNE